MNPAAAPEINGVVETVLYAEDLPRAMAFYCDVLGLRPMKGDGVRFQALRAGAAQVLLLFKRGATLVPTPTHGGIIPPHDGRGPHHVGFAISADAYAQWSEWLKQSGVVIESEGHWDRGGAASIFAIRMGIWLNW